MSKERSDLCPSEQFYQVNACLGCPLPLCGVESLELVADSCASSGSLGIQGGGSTPSVLLIKHNLIILPKGWPAKFLKLVTLCLATVGWGPPVHPGTQLPLWTQLLCVYVLSVWVSKETGLL